MKDNKFSVLFLLSTIMLLAVTNISAQNHSRFMKIDKWKVTFEASRIGREITPDTMQNYDALFKEWMLEAAKAFGDNKTQDVFEAVDFMVVFLKLGDNLLRLSNKLNKEYHTFSVNHMNEVFRGSIIFDQDDIENWTGSGNINYSIQNISVGLNFGSVAGSSLMGNGITQVNTETTYLSIYPQSGTFEITISPGKGDYDAGMVLSQYSIDKLGADFAESIIQTFKGAEAADNENIIEEWNEMSKPEYLTGDAYNDLNLEQWYFFGSGELPSTGLILEGQQSTENGYFFKWKIEPQK